MNHTFYANRTKGTFIGLSVGFLIIFSSTGLPFLLTPAEERSALGWQLAIPLAIGGFFLYVLVASLFKMFIRYQVNPQGIIIVKPPFHSRTIKKEEIQDVEYLDAQDTASFFEASVAEQSSYGESRDIVGYIRMLKKESPSYKYYTLTASAQVATSGPQERIDSIKVKPSGGMVVLRLKNGDDLYLTPQFPKAFQQAVTAILT